MARELKVTIGCTYKREHNQETFGIPAKFHGTPRLASNQAKYLETVFLASGVDQANAGYDAGMIVVGTGVTQVDTFNNAKITTHGWMFMKNIESVPSGDYIEWGPRVQFTGCDSAISMSSPDGTTAFTFTGDSGNQVLIPFGRLEAGESAAMRVTPSGLSIGARAGSGLLAIASGLTPGATFKYIIFAD